MKARSIVLFAICALLLGGCSPQASSTAPDPVLEQIILYGDSYIDASDYIDLDILTTTEYITQVDTPENPSEFIELQGKEIPVTYSETWYFTAGKKGYVQKYNIDGTEDGNILLNEDGSIYAIRRYPFDHLNIQQNDSEETVLAALKEKASYIIDFSKYSQYKCTHAHSETDRFYTYFFVFYNTYQGYITNRTSVYVRDDGNLGGLWIINPIEDEASLEFVIDKDKETQLLQQKVDSVLGQNTKLVDIKISSTPEYVWHNDKLSVKYFIGAQVDHESTATALSFGFYALIPVELICA